MHRKMCPETLFVDSLDAFEEAAAFYAGAASVRTLRRTTIQAQQAAGISGSDQEGDSEQAEGLHEADQEVKM